MKQVSRYHPLLVTLHWALAVLIIAALVVGFFVLAATPNADPQKISVLRVHMAGGMLILALMVIRFIVRVSTSRPADATTGYPLLDRIAPITHYGFYVLVLLMVGSGYATGISCGSPGDRFRWLRRAVAADFRDLSELCGTRLYRGDSCRLHRFTRPCRVLPSIRHERRIVPANVLRATCPQSIDTDEMTSSEQRLCPVRAMCRLFGPAPWLRVVRDRAVSLETQPITAASVARIERRRNPGSASAASRMSVGSSELAYR